jgi:hypothetical protein
MRGPENIWTVTGSIDSLRRILRVIFGFLGGLSFLMSQVEAHRSGFLLRNDRA